MYTATMNVPGHPPWEDPHTFDTATEAWWYLYQERCHAETATICDLCDGTMTHGPSGDCDDDSETGVALGQAARAGQVGSIHGPTPGYRGEGDPGVLYSVTEHASTP